MDSYLLADLTSILYLLVRSRRPIDDRDLVKNGGKERHCYYLPTLFIVWGLLSTADKSGLVGYSDVGKVFGVFPRVFR